MSFDKAKAIEAADRHIEAGQFQKAAASYTLICADDPSDLPAVLRLGDLHHRADSLELALKSWADGAAAYVSEGSLLKAVAVYKRMLRLDGGLHSVHVGLARVYEQLGLLNDAVSQFQEAIAVLGARRKTIERLYVIRELLTLDPENVRARVRLAEDFVAEGRTAEGVTELRLAADRLDAEGYTDDFIRVAERLLYHQPDDTATARRLAELLIEQESPQAALPRLQACFRVNPFDVDVLDMLAQAFTQLGQGHKALTVLKELARIHDRNGLIAERDEVLERILESHPSDRSTRHVLDQLRKPQPKQSDEMLAFDELEDLPRTGSTNSSIEESEPGFGDGYTEGSRSNVPVSKRFDDLDELAAVVAGEAVGSSGVPNPSRSKSGDADAFVEIGFGDPSAQAGSQTDAKTSLQRPRTSGSGGSDSGGSGATDASTSESGAESMFGDVSPRLREDSIPGLSRLGEDSVVSAPDLEELGVTDLSGALALAAAAGPPPLPSGPEIHLEFENGSDVDEPVVEVVADLDISDVAPASSAPEAAIESGATTDLVSPSLELDSAGTEPLAVDAAEVEPVEAESSVDETLAELEFELDFAEADAYEQTEPSSLAGFDMAESFEAESADESPDSEGVSEPSSERVAEDESVEAGDSGEALGFALELELESEGSNPDWSPPEELPFDAEILDLMPPELEISEIGFGGEVSEVSDSFLAVPAAAEGEPAVQLVPDLPQQTTGDVLEVEQLLDSSGPAADVADVSDHTSSSDLSAAVLKAGSAELVEISVGPIKGPGTPASGPGAESERSGLEGSPLEVVVEVGFEDELAHGASIQGNVPLALADELREFDFYLRNDMVDTARSVLMDLPPQFRDHPEVSRRLAELESR